MTSPSCRFLSARLVDGVPRVPVFLGVCDLERSLREGLSGPRALPTKDIETWSVLSTSRRLTSVSIDLIETLHALPIVARGGPRRLAQDRTFCLSLGLFCAHTQERMIFGRVHAVAHARNDEPAPIMIGMDLLRQVIVHIDGPTKSVTIERR